MLSSLLAALTAVGGLLSRVLDWFQRQELVDLGRLKEQNEQLTQAAEARVIADRIDDEPDVTDGDELLRRLSHPSPQPD